MTDKAIPLTKVRSNASSTGARKANQTTTGLTTTTSKDEKRGVFHRHGGKRKKKTEETLMRKDSGDEGSLTGMGRLYANIKQWSSAFRYIIFIVPVALLLAAPIIVLPLVGMKDDIPLGKKENGQPGPPLFLLFLWIEISWLSIWIGKLVAFILPRVFIFFCGVVSSGTRKYATVLSNLTIPLSLFFWALASFVSFRGLFRDHQDVPWVSGLEKFLIASFASSGVYLGEKGIVQLIGISYHQRSFANRIKDSKREVQLLGMLYDASRNLFPMYCPEFADEDYTINDSIDMMLARKAGGKGGSGNATPMRLVGDVGRLGDKVTSIFGNIASEITGKQVFNPNSAHSIVVEALEKVKSSEALGRRIWMSFVCEGKDALFLEDVEEVLGPAYSDEAAEAFGAVDNDENGDISLDEMVRKVVEIGTERKAISEGMKDISQALQVFDKVLLFVVLLIIVFIFLIVYDGNVLRIVGTAGTALLSLSFVFAVTTQEFLGSCIFLFVKHPYDVGDRVDIRVGPEKILLQVEKISLLYTVFLRIDMMQIVQTPNIQLNNLWIENVTRSKAMKEVIDLNVSYDTTFEDIELLRAEMENFVRSPDNSRDFQPDFSIGVAGVGDLDKLNLKVAIKHKSNWHNEVVRATRRSKFICALTLALKKIPIYKPGGGDEALGSVGNPTYSVTVTDEDAASKRDEAAKKKEGKRMVPSKVDEEDTEKEGVEKQAIQDFNSRNAAVAATEDWGYSRDDKTLAGGSREQSEDRRRSNEVKRGESQRGLRKAGDSVAPSAIADSAPGVSLTHASPTRRHFDEEAQTGPAPSAYPGGFFATAPVMGGASSSTSNNPYSLFPPNLGSVQEQPPHPLQSQPAAPSGSRNRGYSVSRNQGQQGQGPPGLR